MKIHRARAFIVKLYAGRTHINDGPSVTEHAIDSDFFIEEATWNDVHKMNDIAKWFFLPDNPDKTNTYFSVNCVVVSENAKIIGRIEIMETIETEDC